MEKSLDTSSRTPETSWWSWLFNSRSSSTTSSPPSSLLPLLTPQLESFSSIPPSSIRTISPMHTLTTQKTAQNGMRGLRFGVYSNEDVDHKSSINLQFCERLTQEEMIAIAKHTRNHQVINMSNSIATKDEKLQCIIPWLIKNNPELKTLNIEGTYLHQKTLKKLLNGFPQLEVLNIQSIDTIHHKFKILMPWIRNNRNLKSLLANFSINSLKKFDAFVDVTTLAYVINHNLNLEFVNTNLKYGEIEQLRERCNSRSHSVAINGKTRDYVF